MEFVGRSRELGQLRSLLDRPDASLIRVGGMRGGGKTALVRRAAESFPNLHFPVPPLPEPMQRAAFRAALGRLGAHAGSDAGAPGGLGGEGAAGAPPTWAAAFDAARERVEPGGSPLVLVIDDARRLAQARARYRPDLLAVLRRARAERRALHVVVVGEDADASPHAEADPLEAGTLTLEPLPIRAAAALLPGAHAAERVRSYAVFGGVPGVLRQLDPTVTLETNVRRLLLEPGGALADAGALWLERDVQTPSRYYAILAALADGEADWGVVHAGVPDLTRSGQVAPYLHRLEELGLVGARRSLDAGPASRARRYRIVDPFLAFWLRIMRTQWGGLGDATTGTPEPRALRAEIDAHVATVFQQICRQHMGHDAMESLGSNARETGSLWGPGYELPVAGVLGSGAVFYGSCHWSGVTRADEPLRHLDEQIRETRYGFGRQQRLRLLFLRDAAPRWLQREIAKRDDVHAISARELAGVER